MQLVYAFLADAADVGRTGKIAVVGGDFESIFVPQVPAVHPQFSIVTRLLVEASECERSHTLELQIVPPGGTSILPVATSEFTPHQIPGREGQPTRYHLVMTLPLVAFIALGEHHIGISVDGVELGVIPFRVELGPMPSPEAAPPHGAE